MIIDFHTHKKETAEGVLAIRSFCITKITQNDFFNTPHSIGLHPWNIPQNNWIDLLRKYSSNPQCLCIGECGIDKLRGIDITSQIAHFKQQIQLSEELKKTLIIHCVKAFNELIEIHKQMKPTQPWIVHGYRNNIQLAQQLRAHNIYISVGTYIMNTQQNKIRNTIKELGIGNFLLETDDDSTPILELYKTVSEILNVPIKELTSKIDNLFVSLQKI